MFASPAVTLRANVPYGASIVLGTFRALPGAVITTSGSVLNVTARSFGMDAGSVLRSTAPQAITIASNALVPPYLGGAFAGCGGGPVDGTPLAAATLANCTAATRAGTGYPRAFGSALAPVSGAKEQEGSYPVRLLIGSVLITADEARLDGLIAADGSYYNPPMAAVAGGAIELVVGRLNASSGVLSAEGGSLPASNCSRCGSGSGGRISLTCGTHAFNASALVSQWPLKMRAYAGVSSSVGMYGAAGTVVVACPETSPPALLVQQRPSPASVFTPPSYVLDPLAALGRRLREVVLTGGASVIFLTPSNTSAGAETGAGNGTALPDTATPTASAAASFNASVASATATASSAPPDLVIDVLLSDGLGSLTLVNASVPNATHSGSGSSGSGNGGRIVVFNALPTSVASPSVSPSPSPIVDPGDDDVGLGLASPSPSAAPSVSPEPPPSPGVSKPPRPSASISPTPSVSHTATRSTTPSPSPSPVNPGNLTLVVLGGFFGGDTAPLPVDRVARVGAVALPPSPSRSPVPRSTASAAPRRLQGSSSSGSTEAPAISIPTSTHLVLSDGLPPAAFVLLVTGRPAETLEVACAARQPFLTVAVDAPLYDAAATALLRNSSSAGAAQVTLPKLTVAQSSDSTSIPPGADLSSPSYTAAVRVIVDVPFTADPGAYGLPATATKYGRLVTCNVTSVLPFPGARRAFPPLTSFNVPGVVIPVA